MKTSLTSKVAVLEAQISDLREIQKEILENTQTILLNVKEQSVEMIQLKKTSNRLERDVNRIEHKLDEKADKQWVNEKIDKLWKYLMWVPGALAAIATILISLF